MIAAGGNYLQRQFIRCLQLWLLKTCCYISLYGDLYPCRPVLLRAVPLAQAAMSASSASGDISRNWRRSARSRARDLPMCSSCVHVSECSRCPGWRTWKATCVARPRRTVKNHTRGRESGVRTWCDWDHAAGVTGKTTGPISFATKDGVVGVKGIANPTATISLPSSMVSVAIQAPPQPPTTR
jgi:hypothetical protein